MTATGATPSTTPSTKASPTGGEPLRVTQQKACLVEQPKSLVDRVEVGWQPDLDGGPFSALAVARGTVYGPGGARGDLLALDVAKRSVTKISEVAKDAAPGWLVTSADRIAWLSYDSPSDPTRWSLYLADRSGANRKRVAGSPADHQEGEGRSTQPAMTGKSLAWTEPVGTRNDRVRLKVLNLADGATAVVAEGDLIPPVAMGDNLVWGEQTASGAVLRAIEAGTGRPVPLPKGLPLKGGVGHLAATSERLLWGSADYRTLSVWQPSQNSVKQFTVGQGDEHVFQFMQPTGDHVAWFASWPSSIMDLRNGVFYDVGKDVTVAAADGEIAISREKKVSQGSAGGRAPARVTVIAEKDLPKTPPCG